MLKLHESTGNAKRSAPGIRQHRLQQSGPIALGMLGTRASLGLLSFVMVAGCSVGPRYKPPVPSLTPFMTAPQIAARKATNPSPKIETWWTGFEDPTLSRMIQRVLDQNLSIAASLARVDQSRAIARRAGARNKPNFTLAADTTTLRQSLESPFGKVSKYVPSYPRNQNYYDLGIAASWELDLFGQLRKGAQAASADAQATEANRAGVQISVTAEAADAYLQLRGDQARIAVAQQQIADDEHLLKLVVQRYQAGIATDRERAQAEALLQQARASVPLLQLDLATQSNRLDVLMAAQPGAYAAELAQPSPIPTLPSIDPLAPLDVLRRRPDVIAAERRLAASNSRIGAALAGYYPTVSLSALVGSESLSPGHLFKEVTFQPESVVGIRWRLFDFGRVGAEVAQARGANAEALIAYRETMLRAAEDVEDAFYALTKSESRLGLIFTEVASLQRSFRALGGGWNP